MGELKTQENEASVEAFLQSVADPGRREDAFQLLQLMQEVTGVAPKMWGGSIVGFGSYHYKYASGHEGDMCRVGFSPRKAALSLYLNCELDQQADLLERLGKHKLGKSCLYVKRLKDVDLDVLGELISSNFRAD